jgi:hypothetical protein
VLTAEEELKLTPIEALKYRLNNRFRRYKDNPKAKDVIDAIEQINSSADIPKFDDAFKKYVRSVSSNSDNDKVTDREISFIFDALGPRLKKAGGRRTRRRKTKRRKTRNRINRKRR